MVETVVSLYPSGFVELNKLIITKSYNTMIAIIKNIRELTIAKPRIQKSGAPM